MSVKLNLKIVTSRRKKVVMMATLANSSAVKLTITLVLIMFITPSSFTLVAPLEAIPLLSLNSNKLVLILLHDKNQQN
uniref:Uncharacterized protein n=1 Tax=Manihot esculenta TaxID=3983 RepID=A0A2C9U9Q1_MANES